MKKGKTIAIGQNLDPSKIDDLFEIKTSIAGKIEPDQLFRLKNVM